MKRIGLALACFVFAGTAGAAILAVPPTSETATATSQERAISPVVKVAAPVTIESRRAPVPYVPQPKTPVPQLASLVEPPPPALAEAPPPRAPQRLQDIGRATATEVRNLSQDRCGGRAIKSIAIGGDGRVDVQC